MIRFILKSIAVAILSAIVVYLVLWIGRLLTPEVEPLWGKVREHVIGSLSAKKEAAAPAPVSAVREVA